MSSGVEPERPRPAGRAPVRRQSSADLEVRYYGYLRPMSVQAYRESYGYGLPLPEADLGGYAPDSAGLEPYGPEFLTAQLDRVYGTDRYADDCWEDSDDAARWLPELLEDKYTGDGQDG